MAGSFPSHRVLAYRLMQNIHNLMNLVTSVFLEKEGIFFPFVTLDQDSNDFLSRER